MGLILSAHCLAPVAPGAKEPNVLRLVAPAHRPPDNVVVLDELVRSAVQASSHVPLVYETLHVLRNGLAQMGIELPRDALSIIAFQHRQKRRYIRRAVVTRLPAERVPPPPPLASARTGNEHGKIAVVVP